MKIIFIAAIAALMSFNSVAQKKSPIKYNAKSVKLQYFHLPELEGLEEHVRYRIHLSVADANFRHSVIHQKKAIGADLISLRSGLLLPKKPCSAEECHLDISVKAMSQESSNQRKAKREEVIKKTDGSSYKQMRYSYDFDYSQTIHVVIKDKVNGDKILHEEEFTITGTYSWPRDFNHGIGYSNETALINEFNRFKNEGALEAQKGKAILEAGLNADGGDRLESLLLRQKAPTSVWLFIPKSKDDRFARLDSAYIYLNAGIDGLKTNKKNGVYLNAHEESVFKNFDNAYRIFSEFSYDHVLELLGNESWAKEFAEYNRIPLMLSAMFSSHYEEAVTVVEGHAKTKKEKEDAVMNQESQTKQTFGLIGLQLTDGGKVNREIKMMLPLLIREIKHYDDFKIKYGYWK